MNRSKLSVMCLSLLSLLLVTGCEESTGKGREAIKAALEDFIGDDDELTGFDEYDDGGALDEEFGAIGGAALKTLDDYYPADSLVFRFGRRVTGHEREVTHEFQGDSAVVSTVVHTIEGNFITVVMDTTGGVVDSFAKPFVTTATQRVRFVRVGNAEDEHNNWHFAAATALAGSAGSKIGIDSLVVTNGNGETIVVLAGESILETFFDRESLEELQAGDTVGVRLYVSNTGPVYNLGSGEGAFLRMGRGHFSDNPSLHQRRHLFDNGTHGDAAANDNEFTRFLQMHPPQEGHNQQKLRMLFDVIDFETLYSSDSDAGVHTAVWRIPYRVIR